MRFDRTQCAVFKDKGSDLEELDGQKTDVGENVTSPGKNGYVLIDRGTLKDTFRDTPFFVF